MKQILFIILLLSKGFCVLGQSFTIKGAIRDVDGLPLPYATLQLISTDTKQPVSHAISDPSGNYTLSVSRYGDFELVVNSLGYLTVKRLVSFSSASEKERTLGFTLENNPVALKEVVVRAQEYGRISQDTVNYYIKQYTDGSERVLKDILSKLPGIEIRDNGSITANGKDVDKLLIDGEDFFFNQPKMATENLSAAMVSNVQLLNNYYSNTLQKDFSQDGQTVLNIRLKNEFRGKPSGDLSLGGGIKGKYGMHSNAYIFSKKLKVGLIDDINNTGTHAYTFENLNVAGGGIEQLAQNDISRGSITQFTQSKEFIGMSMGNNAKSKNSGLIGFNMNYLPNEKTKVNTNFVVNKNFRDEYENINRIYLLSAGRGLTSTESQKKMFFGSAFVDASYKWSRNMRLVYRASLGFNKTSEAWQINDLNMTDSTFFNQNKDGRQWSFNQLANLTCKTNEKTLIGVSLFQELNKTVSSLDLVSDSLFLGLPFEASKNYMAKQDYNTMKNLMGAEFSYSRKLRKTLVRSIAGFSMNTWPLSSQLLKNTMGVESADQEISEFSNALTYKSTDLRFETYWIKNQGKFQFKVGPGLHYYTSRLNDNQTSSRFAVLPNILLLLKFREGHDLMAGYQVRNLLPGALDLSQGSIVNNFRTLSMGGLNVSNYSLHQLFSLQYVFFDVFSGTILSSSLRYSNNRRPVTTSVTTNTSYNVIASTSGRFTDDYSAQLALDKRLGFIPVGFSLHGLASNNTFDNYLNGNYNKIRSITWQVKSGLSTRFRFPVNAETGIEYMYVSYKSGISNSSQRFDSYWPYLRVNSSFKNGIRANVSLSQAIYSTSTQNNRSWILDFDCSYRPEKRKTELFLTISNLLNMNNYKWVDTRYEQNFFEERQFRIIPGYAMIGIKYNFR